MCGFQTGGTVIASHKHHFKSFFIDC